MKSTSKAKKRTTRATLRVLLIDDERDYFKKLKRAHPDYRFDYSNNINNVIAELEQRSASGEWPDLLLLDVYWPKLTDPKRVRDSREETEHLLTKQVRPAIDKLNKAYLSAFEKFGTRVLAQIRTRFAPRELPIIMYSSKGHFLLRDPNQDWLSETIEQGASWLAKGTVTTNAEKLVFQRMTTKPRSVFIGHGRSTAWKALASFLDSLKLPWDEFNRIATEGMSTNKRLDQMLNNAAIAFLVATAEDEQKGGTKRARENVIHEIGLFQGRLGFERAVVMLEGCCNEFSNIHGTTQIRFARGRIQDTFEKVVGVLKRERLLPMDFQRKPGS